MDDTRNIRIHIVIFLTMIVLYGINFVDTEKYIAGLLTHIAIMVSAIYFKIKRQ